VDRIYLARCRDRWWTFVFVGMNFVLSKMEEVS
jgi:hypothetical protein